MPELPEMENYKLLLSKLILNKPITAIEVNRERSINVPVNTFKEELINQQIFRIERRAKHLLFWINDDQALLLHLMLGGWMFYGTEAEKPDRTIQVKLSFGDNHLYFIGLRLGYLHLLNKIELEDKLNKLGPEPLAENFNYETFKEMIADKRGVLKTTLTDQKFISGIGNCYSDEICFSASLLPVRTGNELKESEINQLYTSMQSVLKEATHHGGYMESPLYKGDELTGSFDSMCRVYDREDEPCTRCGNPIVKDTISSKKSFYCKVCQH